MAHNKQAIANGIRTDHPIPGLPFVDDSHIPVDDPDGIERLGRDTEYGRWGRVDRDQADGEWSAYTTDPKNPELAWVVRYHPQHGRSVTVYTDPDARSVQHDWYRDRALLVRAGGYWWDGTRWYRPSQVLSYATETYMQRPARSAVSVTAADMLDRRCDPERGAVGSIMRLTPTGEQVPATTWNHDLALWAQRRDHDLTQTPRSGAPALLHCVVTVTAPELAADTLLGPEEFAEMAGIPAPTLRGYLSRNQADLPAPQVSDGSRRRWSRPVVEDWLEQRSREPENVGAVLTDDPASKADGEAETSAETNPGLPGGLRRLWARLTEALFQDLWEPPATRKRWSRQHRNERAVRALATRAGWTAALHLDSELPFEELSATLENAILWDMRRDTDPSERFADLSPQIGKMLGWFVTYKTDFVPRLFGAIVHEAQTEHGIPYDVIYRSLRLALRMDGGFSDRTEQLNELMKVAMPPKE